MLNFVLAIVVEAYMKVRKDIEELEVESSIVWDLMTVCMRGIVGLYRRWPTRRNIANRIRNTLALKNISAGHLHPWQSAV